LRWSSASASTTTHSSSRLAFTSSSGKYSSGRTNLC
jgi:hypothetical protein